MSKRRDTMSRRYFLRGAGGAVMAIPFLPSLATRASTQADATGSPSKCFFAIGTDHGNVWGGSIYPDASVLTDETVYAGRTVRHGALPTAADAGGEVALSEMCRASASVLTPGLVAKFNILRGLDIPYRIGHHTGGHLGNFAATVGNVTAGLDNTAFMTASIDQAIAWAPGFYTQEDLDTRMTQRTFNVGSGAMSWNFASPSAKAGAVVMQPAHRRNHDLFRYFFEPGSAFNGVDAFLVDRIKASYERLRVHPRLSAGDRLRLDAHVERMAEVERKLNVITQLAAPPPPPETDSNVYYDHHSFPHDPTENQLYCGLMNDVIVAAFAAGVSRVGTWYQTIRFADQLIQDWHGQVAHEGFQAQTAQQWTLGFNRGSFAHVMVDLAAKMDGVVMEDGSTLLDNSLVMLTSEAGQITHHTGSMSYPVVTAGGAGGFFKTGQFVDFGDQTIVYDDLAEVAATNPLIQLESPGLYYNQFLANVVCSMGVAPVDFGGFTDFTSGEPTGGYGFHHVDADRADDYAQARAVLDDLLPVIT